MTRDSLVSFDWLIYLEHYEMNFCSFLEIEQTIFAFCGFMGGLTELILPGKIEQCEPNIKVSEPEKCKKMEIVQPNSQVTTGRLQRLPNEVKGIHNHNYGMPFYREIYQKHVSISN
jgi:hypothetical protein